ncbi:MAG: CBS domain-containing protein [Calothrix sp. MO_192.B10]|nr:CBS domain-containing protein [Calothrix sp. MO_192.B10]
MQLDDPLICTPIIEAAIDHQPLTVSPDTPLVTVIDLMHKTRGSSCMVSTEKASSSFPAMHEARSSCILITENTKLIGIFTERDIVRLTAGGINFEAVTIGSVMVKSVITLPKSACQDIFAALFLFRRYRIRHLPVVGEEGELLGVVSPESIRRVLRPANLLKLRRVSEVMTTKLIHAPMTTSVMHIAKLMAKHQVSCVVITEEIESELEHVGTIPVGIITERDIVQFGALQLDLSQLKAETVMSTPLFLLSPEDSLWTAHQEMLRRNVQRLVVSWDWGKGLGIVTQTNLLRIFDPMEMYGVIETLQHTVQQIETEKDQNSSHNQDPLKQSLPTDKQSSNSHVETSNELQNLLSGMKNCLESLVCEPDISPEKRQKKLMSALARIEKLESLVQKSSC